ncbi:uncharacterized protein DNG_07323 [Cephalotrichum gorgonifer]|uniref:Xylanolytic transcriptional activator regulatory domain-containing protein n=1 Tax=Cephalotrichum gorgonifer TaxID=2041049 RepID=A0AAE8N395_9PEZI|nr:uncharacterized protein DNG_07323 [Cephalotrichum gorgonifer]
MGSSNNIPVFTKAGHDWIRRWTGEEPSFNQLYALDPPKESQYQRRPVQFSLDPEGTSPDVNLPSRDIMERFVDSYCSTGFHNAFPIIDPVLFGRTLDTAYTASPNPSLEVVEAQASLYSFMSLVSLCQWEWGPSHLPSVDGGPFAFKVRTTMSEIFLQVSITNLQTTVMLYIFYLFSGDPHHGKLFHSLACRMMFALGGHLDPANLTRCTQPAACAMGAESPRMKAYLRQLFWIIYSFDKEISLRTRQPPSIDDDYCDLTVPDTSKGQELSGDDPDGERPLPIAHPANLKLAIIKSKIFKRLYSASAFRKQDAELLRDIREMDDELERWRLSVPAAYRPNLGFSSKAASRPSRPPLEVREPFYTPTQLNRAQFGYLYLMAAIHRASGRCRGWAGGDSVDSEGISSSMAICLQASRSSIVHLRAVLNVAAQEVLAYIIFYPMSAALTIFCNILLDPLDPQAAEDLQLISSVPKIIQTMPRPPRYPKDELYVQMVNAFFVELARIASCAVDKATSSRVRRIRQEPC